MALIRCPSYAVYAREYVIVFITSSVTRIQCIQNHGNLDCIFFKNFWVDFGGFCRLMLQSHSYLMLCWAEITSRKLKACKSTLKVYSLQNFMSSFFEVVMVMRSGLLGHWNQQIVYLKWFSKVGFQHTSNFITKCPCSCIWKSLLKNPIQTFGNQKSK